MVLSKEKFASYLYNLMPEIYRTEDSKNDYVLKKYIQATVDGGFGHLIDKINSFTDINNPEKCPEELFPYLFESNGLKYQPSVDIKYQRKILSNIGELYRRRGTYNAIRYLIRVLTNLDATMTMEKVLDETGKVTEKILHIDLIASNLEDVERMDNSIVLAQNYIKDHILYNITPIVVAKLNTQIVTTHNHYALNMAYSACREFYPFNMIYTGASYLFSIDGNGDLIISYKNTAPKYSIDSSGNLIYTYTDGTVAPNMYINDEGYLIAETL